MERVQRTDGKPICKECAYSGRFGFCMFYFEVKNRIACDQYKPRSECIANPREGQSKGADHVLPRRGSCTFSLHRRCRVGVEQDRV